MTKTAKSSLVLPKGAAIYAHLLEPDNKAPKDASFKPDNKYKITILYDSEAEIGELQEAVMAFAKAKWPDLDADEVKTPWTSYDQDDAKEYRAGKTGVIAKSKFKPSLVDSKKKALPASVKVFSGDIVRAVVNLFPYEQTEQVREGKKTVTVKVYGVSLQLNAVQLVEKRAGGGGADMFDDIDGFEAEDDSVATGSTGADISGADF